MPESDPSPDTTPTRARPERPPPCRRCHSPTWWNGWRRVFAVLGLADLERIERWLPRAKCPACVRGFTVYSDAQYPHRQYQLDAVADTAAAVAFGGESAAKAAARTTASETSARRWTAWVADLAGPAELLAAAQQISPDDLIGAGLSTIAIASPVRVRAARVLAALEHLGAALVRHGVDLVSRTGLGRVLEWQHRAHETVIFLVAEPRCLSPTMAPGRFESP